VAYAGPARPVAVCRFRGNDASSLTRSLRSGRETAAGVADSHKVTLCMVREQREGRAGGGFP